MNVEVVSVPVFLISFRDRLGPSFSCFGAGSITNQRWFATVLEWSIFLTNHLLVCDALCGGSLMNFGRLSTVLSLRQLFKH
jgi:hypothetical protein